MMKNLLIRLLGGMTRLQHLEEMEKMRSACEKFAIENLSAAYGKTIFPFDVFEGYELKEDAIVIGSCARFYNSKVRKIIVAPWVVNTIVIGCRDSEGGL